MEQNIFAEIEKMTEEEKKSLLNTQFPEELEKEAAAELDTTLLADALYSYGYLQAQRSLAEVDGLDKVAAEDLKAHEQAEAEVSAQIEACLNSLGTPLKEDQAELHKEAQVAAAIIFDGFSDCLEEFMEKNAAMAPKIKAMGGKVMAHLRAAGGKAKHHAGRAGAFLKKHKGKAGLAAGGIAAGTYAAHRAMSKKSSEMTADELVELASEVALEKQAMIDTIAEGIDKLAAKGAHKGKKMHEMFSKASKSSKSSASSKSS